MRFKFILGFVAFLFAVIGSISAQELNCTVSVNSSQIQSSDKKVYETLQNAVTEFMNTRKWTSDQFLNQERIDCSILITISERVATDEFKATLQIQTRRPIYKSSYNSTIFNFNDVDFNFKYLEFQALDFNESVFTSNLTSVLSFYAYMIIGLDYDSFSPNGGTPYFQKAQAIVNNAQNTSDKGWKAFDGTRNRYWLAENLLNPIFAPLRLCYYKYHRGGFDMLTDNKALAMASINEGLMGLKNVYAEKPGSFLLQLFFNAKTDEIINLYSQATPEDKAKIINLLSEIDPANGVKYQTITK
jgi:hypothetical protein